MPNTTGLEQELSFVENEFKTSYSYKSVLATAKRFQNLLLMEKNTIPSLPDCGIGIKTKLFRFNDSTSIANISREINNQISQYLPTSRIISVEILPHKDATGNKDKGLVIYLMIATEDTEGRARKIAVTAIADSSSPYKETIASDIYL